MCRCVRVCMTKVGCAHTRKNSFKSRDHFCPSSLLVRLASPTASRTSNTLTTWALTLQKKSPAHLSTEQRKRCSIVLLTMPEAHSLQCSAKLFRSTWVRLTALATPKSRICFARVGPGRQGIPLPTCNTISTDFPNTSFCNTQKPVAQDKPRSRELRSTGARCNAAARASRGLVVVSWDFETSSGYFRRYRRTQLKTPMVPPLREMQEACVPPQFGQSDETL